MNTIAEPAREIPVAGEYDVLVAGGGLAGTVAAIAAARNGARTLVVERFGIVGGTATAGLMTSFNGFRNERPPNDLQTVKGLGQEVVDRLIAVGGATGLTSHGDFTAELRPGHAPYAVGYDPDALQLVLLQMLKEADARVLLHTYIARAHVSGRQILGLIVENKSGRQALLGKVTVDATGDGDVSAFAGAPFLLARKAGERMMPATLMVRVANVHPERIPERTGSIVHGNTAVVWGPSVRDVDGTDAWDLTRAEVEAREALPAFIERLRERPGFEDCVLVSGSSAVGIRETRRVRGEYVITEADAIEGHRFPDVIAISSNPVPGYYGKRRFLEHEGFDIPYRALVPLEVEGLLLSGRCISAEQVPFQSARSQAPLMAISQAVGTAAALCATADVTPRRCDVPTLQRRLLEQGAELRLSR
ncbi:MAG TPA: FAD-dependent oxidoreductase [Chloroflexota bacterium]